MLPCWIESKATSLINFPPLTDILQILNLPSAVASLPVFDSFMLASLLDAN